ncbi:MAG: HlyD family secretion protein [Gammaproteobacteria bacterium]|nr:MAG: HlyD family secretion protein [Gammaproteobacteria bacterium]
MKNKLIPIILVLLAGGGYWYYQQKNQSVEQPGITHSNGRLELSRMDVASLYPGRVEQVVIEEGQYVTPGEVLAILSSETTQAKHHAALAQQNASRAKQRQAEKAVKHIAAQLIAQQQQIKVTQLDVDNALALHKNKLISQSELDKRIAARDAATASLTALQFAQKEAEAAVQQATAGVQQAEAQVEQIDSMLGDLRIKAPKAGRVQYKLVEMGSVVGPGSKIVSLLDLGDVSMNLFLPGPVVNTVALNSEARIVLDGQDYVFPAKVTFIASDAQFTPKHVETKSERAKLMFKVKLKIPVAIARRYQNYLRGGMAGDGYVLTEPKAVWTDDLAVRLPKIEE